MNQKRIQVREHMVNRVSSYFSTETELKYYEQT